MLAPRVRTTANIAGARAAAEEVASVPWTPDSAAPEATPWTPGSAARTPETASPWTPSTGSCRVIMATATMVAATPAAAATSSLCTTTTYTSQVRPSCFTFSSSFCWSVLASGSTTSAAPESHEGCFPGCRQNPSLAGALGVDHKVDRARRFWSCVTADVVDCHRTIPVPSSLLLVLKLTTRQSLRGRLADCPLAPPALGSLRAAHGRLAGRETKAVRCFCVFSNHFEEAASWHFKQQGTQNV
mmetsp:Transcript_126367/g.319102  ORF Transcript_126367/g.319102 Transcript_126367/m.319102 type:complete len:243 (-) Transcript_126367:170-898(-)